MKIKNEKVIRAYNGIRNIINVASEKNIAYPRKFSYALTKNLIMLETLNRAFETERNKMLDECNVKTEDGQPEYKITGKINIDKDFIEKWNKEAAELLDIEVDFEPHKIEFEDIPEEIEPEILYIIDFMIAE